MAGAIYKITNPKGRIYIGQAQSMSERLSHYKGLNCKNQTKLYRSLKKYGYYNHKVKILHNDVLPEEINRLETHYIRHYKCVKSGLNCLPEGGSRMGKKQSAKTILKIQATRALRKHTYKYRATKLTLEKVKEIRDLIVAGNHKIKDLAKMFGISPEHISGIKYNKTWIDPEYQKYAGTLGLYYSHVKLSDEIVRSIRDDIKAGDKKWDIIKKHNLKEHVYKDIRRGYTYKSVV